MSVLEKILAGVRQRRSEEEAQASTSYAELVRRLAAERPERADTAEVVDDLLARSGLGPDDLAADVRAVAAHHAMRQRCRAAAAAREARTEAIAAERAAARRVREETQRLAAEHKAADQAERAAYMRVAALDEDLERVMAAASAELVAGYMTAARPWREAITKLEELHSRSGEEAPPAAAVDELAREVAARRAAVDKALTALLAYEPSVEVVRAGAAK